MAVKPKLSDADVQAILTRAIADSGTTPAAVYAFHKTGVILTDGNEKQIAPERLRAWNAAINEYNALTSRKRKTNYRHHGRSWLKARANSAGLLSKQQLIQSILVTSQTRKAAECFRFRVGAPEDIRTSHGFS
jgi:hypothetical protein